MSMWAAESSEAEPASLSPFSALFEDLQAGATIRPANTTDKYNNFAHRCIGILLSYNFHCAATEIWKVQAASNMKPSPWARLISPPENFFSFEIGRKTTAYSPGNSSDAGDT